METEKILADLHSKIWFFHDEKKFKELGKAAEKLFLVLGFPKKKSSLASKYVTDAYLFYDKAGEYNIKRDMKKREYFFKRVLTEEVKVRKLLGEDIRAAEYENKWWRYFLYRRYVCVFPYILGQEVIKYKGYNPLIPIKTVYYLIKAGFEGHNKRKREIVAKYLEKYWSLTLAHMKDKIQY